MTLKGVAMATGDRERARRQKGNIRVVGTGMPQDDEVEARDRDMHVCKRQSGSAPVCVKSRQAGKGCAVSLTWKACPPSPMPHV